MTKTLKERLISELNVPENDFDNYNSDLYVKHTPERMEWIKTHYEFGNSDSIVSTFRSEINGELYIEVAFGYAEYMN